MTMVTIGLACIPNQDTQWPWFGGCPRVEARRVSPTIDENSIYMHTLKYIMESGEVEGEQLAMTRVLHPWSPHLNIKPATISTTAWDDLIG